MLTNINRYFSKQLPLTLVVLFCIGFGIAFSQTYALSIQLIDSQALQSAKVLAEAMNKSRVLYSDSAVKSAQTVPGITVSPTYHNIPGAIPNPATFAIELGSQLRRLETQPIVRLYSNYPFPNRKETGGPQDKYERAALEFLSAYPQKAFIQKDKKEESRLYRYSEAVLMESSCVECHNRLAESPKKDWKVGDVRGVLSISQPIEELVNLAQSSLYRLWTSFFIFSFLALLGLILIIGKLKHINRNLQAIVDKQTSELKKLATIDGLTQLYNRRYFDEIFQIEWKRMQRQRSQLSLILCDVDYFKQFNDTYGHQAGDNCLVKVAAAIQNVMRRPGDFVARYGGEEFVIVLPHTNTSGAQQITQEIKQAVNQLNIMHEKSCISSHVSLSFGVATISMTVDTQSQTLRDATEITRYQSYDLLHLADQALYEAKAQGRNCSVSKILQ